MYYQLIFLPDFRFPKQRICFGAFTREDYAVEEAICREGRATRYAEAWLVEKSCRKAKTLCKYPCGQNRFNKLMQMPH